MINRISPENINHLHNDEIFVFGSNEAGRHGAGTAKLAKDLFGAVYGIGIGIQGNSYAIPTKDKDLLTLPLTMIQVYVNQFINYAKENPNKKFLVTKIGCGLAGYTPKDIAPLFTEAINIKNIYLPKDFLEILSEGFEL